LYHGSIPTHHTETPIEILKEVSQNVRVLTLIHEHDVFDHEDRRADGIFIPMTTVIFPVSTNLTVQYCPLFDRLTYVPRYTGRVIPFQHRDLPNLEDVTLLDCGFTRSIGIQHPLQLLSRCARNVEKLTIRVFNEEASNLLSNTQP
jgi:hypothetical protein